MKHFGLLGEHLAHSFSPQIHALLGDYEYRLYETAPADVVGFLQAGGFDGLNVTIPYKKTVVPFCGELSDSARKIGSVNTLVRRPDGALFGDNTDYYGFSYLLTRLGIDVEGKKALVLGSGGASLTVRAVLADSGVSEAVTVSRSGKDNYGNISRHHDAELIVNTTPLGMYPNNGESLLDLKAFGRCGAVIDIVYNPSKTALLLDAEDLGVPRINGLPMLVAQAKRAAEIFTGLLIDDGMIGEITEKIERQTKNVALIGMPGSGKSSTGAALARLLGREFFDTDAIVVEAAGKTIPEIFRDDGEEVFRRLETEALREVSIKSGCVISTGGGVVTRPQNYRHLRQNSTVVFLDRDLEMLSSEGRPLSQTSGVAALAEARLPLYNSWCDHKIEVRGADAEQGVKETADRIKELLGL